MNKLLLVGLIALALAGCGAPTGAPVQAKPAKKEDQFNVVMLFEYDGCKVYRFHDMGRYRYFTNCTSTSSYYKSGKSTITEEIPNASESNNE